MKAPVFRRSSTTTSSAFFSRTAPPCPDRLHAPDATYPGTAANNFGVGAVVVRVVLDERGEIVERGVIASVGGDAFRAAVERVLPRWRFDLAENAVQPCSRESVRIIPYLFYIGDDED